MVGNYWITPIDSKNIHINKVEETIGSSISRISIIEDISQKIIDLKSIRKKPITTTLIN